MGYADEVAADNPRHWWRFNEASGPYGFDLGYSRLNCPIAGVSDPGYMGICTGGRSTLINDVGSRYRCPTDQLAIVPGAYSVEGWVWISRLNVIDSTIYHNYWTNNGTYLIITAAQKGQLAVGGSGALTTLDTVSVVPDDQWAHLVGTYDGATARIYLNGALEASVAAVRVMTNAAQELTLGGINGLVGHQLSGALTELAVYDSALSAGRILAHYNAADLKAFPLTYPAPGTQGQSQVIIQQGIDNAATLAQILAAVRATFT